MVFERPKLVHSSGDREKAPVGGKIKIKTILLHFEPISTISLIEGLRGKVVYCIKRIFWF